jgi:hypothetical protein
MDELEKNYHEYQKYMDMIKNVLGDESMVQDED